MRTLLASVRSVRWSDISV